MDSNGTKHWHTTMQTHGTKRDAVHRFGHISHAHGKPIDLSEPRHEPRQPVEPNDGE